MTTTLDGQARQRACHCRVQLWVAESDGVSAHPRRLRLRNQVPGRAEYPARWRHGCLVLRIRADLVDRVRQGVNSILYLGTSAGIYRDLVNTGAVDFYSGRYAIPVADNAVPDLFSNVTAVGADGSWQCLSRRRSDSRTIHRRIRLQVPAGSAPDGQGGIPQPPITVAPSFLTNELTGPGTQFVLGLARTGAVWLPGVAPSPAIYGCRTPPRDSAK